MSLPRVYESFALRCHSGNESMSSWNHRYCRCSLFFSPPLPLKHAALVSIGSLSPILIAANYYSLSVHHWLSIRLPVYVHPFFFSLVLNYRRSCHETVHLWVMSWPCTPYLLSESFYFIFSLSLWRTGSTWAWIVLPTPGWPTSGNCFCWNKIKRLKVQVMQHC